MGAKAKGLLICAGVYAVALAAAVGAGYVVRGMHPLAIVAVADVAGTLVVFAASVWFRNSSLYDPYWSVAPMAIVGYWVWSPASEGLDTTRVAVAIALVWLYGARLTLNWTRGWQGMHQEDWRYVDLKARHGRMYWLVSFSGIHFFPTVLVYGGCLSLYPIFTVVNGGFGLWEGLATLVTVSAIMIETVSDNQLRKFVLSKPEPGTILDTGLWARCRHPNYLGEIGFWWGLYFFALAVDPGYWWVGIGPLSITVLFVTISIPLIDKRHLARRPGYAEHMKRVPGLVPRVLP